MPLPQSTTKDAATKYLKNELGYTDPDQGEIQGAQDELNALIGQANTLESGANLLASSRGARSIFTQNSAKLDGNIQRVTGTAQNYGAVTKDPNTGKTTQGNINAEGAQAGPGFKFAYMKDGTKVQIPADAQSSSYGMTDVPPSGNVQSTNTSGEENPYDKMLNDNVVNLSSQELEAKAIYDDIKTRQDALTAQMITNIQTKYAARRMKMEDLNKRYLEGKRVAGISSGRMEYASGMEEGLLTTEELDGQRRLMEIDGEEQQLILQAQQARSESQYKAFNDYMGRLDAINKEKADTIQKLHQNAIDQDKAIEDKRRNAITDAKTIQETQLKAIEQLAPAALNAISGLDETASAEVISQLAKQYDVDPNMLISEVGKYSSESKKEAIDIKNIESQIRTRENQEARLAKESANGGKKTQAEKKADVYSGINQLLTMKNADGMPYVDAEGYFTSLGFKELIKNAVEDGVSRAEFVKQYADYLSPWGAKAYGLTPAEQKLLQKEDVQTINRDFIGKTYDLDGSDLEDAVSLVERYRSTGYSEKEILKQLEEKYNQ